MTAPPGTVGLHVRVTDPAGLPIAGLQGSLVDPRDGREQRPDRVGPGEVFFTSPLGGPCILRVYADHHYLERREIDLPANGTVDLSLMLRPFVPASELRVVTSADGPAGPTPVASSEIEGTWVEEGGKVVGFDALTNDEGAVVLDLPGSGTAHLVARHDFFEDANRDIASPAQGAVALGLDLVLARGARWVEGRVSTETGAPLLAAKVRLDLPLDGGFDPTWIPTRSTARTGAEGGFVLAAPGSIGRVELETTDDFPAVDTFPAGTNAHPSLVATARPPRSSVFEGRTLDEATGAPLAGANVSFLAWAGDHIDTGWVHSDTRGRFSLPAPVSASKLAISCDESCGEGAPRGIVLRVPMAMGERVLGDVPLTPDPDRGNVTGRVVDDEGKAVPDARIALFDPSRERATRSATSSLDGSFRLPGADIAGARIIVRGPGSPASLAGLLTPTGRAARVIAVPAGDADLGDIILPKEESVTARLDVRTTRDGLVFDLNTTLLEGAPLVRDLLVDLVLGDGDGRVSRDEWTRAQAEASRLDPFPLAAFTLLVEQQPAEALVSPARLWYDGSTGRIGFVEHAVVPIEVTRDARDVTLDTVRPPFASLHVVAGVDPSAPELLVVPHDGREATEEVSWDFPGETATPTSAHVAFRIGGFSRATVPSAPLAALVLAASLASSAFRVAHAHGADKPSSRGSRTTHR